MLMTTSPAGRLRNRRASGAEPAAAIPSRNSVTVSPRGACNAAVLARQPIGAAEFATLLEPFRPFESSPALAVAVSGGADSLALCLLAQEWAAQRGAAITALTVDHGLRAGSADEAALVGDRLRSRGIEHRVLPWRGAKPLRGVQAKARDARYGLLRGWCREHGVLHLLVAHHADDQAETLLMRAGRASGFDGLAGMAALLDTDTPRLLRPLLGLGRARLRATLEARGQAWIEDPSNRDPRFARVRVRAALERGAWNTGSLSGVAARIGDIRAFDESFTNEWLARFVVLHPAGYAWLDLEGLRSAPAGLALRMLSRTVSCIGGRGYPPRRQGLARTYRKLLDEDPRRATLGGCLLSPQGGRVLVCRESRGNLPISAVRRGQPALWDGRFEVKVPATGDSGGGELQVKALGRRGWEMIVAEGQLAQKSGIPGPARFVLPALWRGGRVLAAPHLDYRAVGGASLSASFRPIQPFVPSYFAVARARTGTI